MPLNADSVRAWSFSDMHHTIDARDAMLYAVSIGAGSDPLDRNGLRFAYEEGLEVFPTFGALVCNPGPWTNDPKTGVTRHMVVHGGVSVQNHRPLPVGRPLVGACKVIGLEDKGAKGAVITIRRTISDAASGDLLTTINNTTFARADGGFGGDWGESYHLQPLPDRPPDLSVETELRPDAALLYRLNGDYNPLHADPAFAARAGYDRPIHHGLGTFGLAAWRLLHTLAPTGTLSLIEGRFSSVAFPGDDLVLDIWRTENEVAFRVRSPARDTVLIDMGRARLAA